MLREAMRPVWAEIDLNNIKYNVKQIQAKIGNAEIIGVVKADAYGHGSLEVSKVLLENGVKKLAIGTIQEAITLRENGITSPIIMLGLTPPLYHDILVEYQITPVTGSYENAKSLSDAAKVAGVVMEGLLTIDTGMGRIGFLPTDESVEEIAKISQLDNFKIQGIYSHFSSADDKDRGYTNLQIERYNEFYEKLAKRNLHHAVRSFANSAAIMEFPNAYYDAVRPGIILYGCYPSPHMDKSHLSLKPVMSVKANIIHLKEVGPGFSVSYGRKFTTKRDSLIGTLALGYADGYPWQLSGRGRVIINGVYAPVIGNICMDQCLVDVTDVPDVKLGDEVILMGSQGDLSITADEIAEKIGTIGYEVICSFGIRLPKVYVK